MNLLKHSLLTAYYTSTIPQRRRAARRRAAAGGEPVSILFYHRVADDSPNAWTMRCRTFRRQMEWVARRFEVVSLQEAQQRIVAGRNDRPTVAITFDDGYADNCDFALPLLLRMGLPFTYFVATDHARTGLPFAHDVAAGVKLRPNTIEQIRSLAAAGVEVGAHTRSHADLGRIRDRQQLRDEIAGSKRDLEAMIDRPVEYFACPFGLHANLSADAFATCYEAGFAGVCSAYGAYNLPGGDAFHLRRIHADPELLRLKNWLTVDPRKARVADFDPGDYKTAAAAPAGGSA